MRTKKNTINSIVLYLLLYAAAGTFRTLPAVFVWLPTLQSYQLILYLAIVFIWEWRSTRAFIQKRVVNLVKAVSIFMVVWLVIRCIRYDLSAWLPVFERSLWYVYYIPIIFIPLLILFVMLYIDKREDERPGKGWYSLFFAAGFLVTLVLTNDLHFLAFRPKSPDADWKSGSYSYGPVYVAVVCWMSLMILTILFITLRKFRSKNIIKKLWQPVVIVAAGFVFAGANIAVPSFLGKIVPWRLPETIILLIILFVESMVMNGFFLSNSNYEGFIDKSSFGMGINDRSGKLVYSSSTCPEVSSEDIKKALDSPVTIPGSMTVLFAKKIRGGTGFWARDKSAIQKMNEELSAIGDVMKEENAMLAGENRITEDRERLKERNRLYDELNESMEPQLQMLDELLKSPAKDEAEFENTLKYACIIAAFIKRYSNLKIIAESGKAIDVAELKTSVLELNRYINHYGVSAYAEVKGEGEVPYEHALCVILLIEMIVEKCIPSARAFFLSVEVKEGETVIRTETAGASSKTERRSLDELVCSLPHELDLSYDAEEKTERITLKLFEGGDRL